MWPVLESATIRQSHKHPTLCTITVDGFKSPTNETLQDQEQHWRLRNTDPRNEGKFLFRLHTLDVYFWKAEDANSFIANVSRILQQGQVEILDAPPAPAQHTGFGSPVVQKLEKVAIHDPAYQNGQTRTSQPTTRVSRAPSSASSTQATLGRETPIREDPNAFKPMAYNPAAPPAPEPIRHREKTPPPPDAEHGTGLSAAAQHDHAQQFSPLPSPMPLQSQSSLSRPPYGHSPLSYGYGSNPPGQGHLSHLSTPHPSTTFSPPPSAAPGHPIPHMSSPPSTVPGQRTPSVSSIPPAQSGRTSANPYGSTHSAGPLPSHRSSVSSQNQQLTMSFGQPPIDPNVQPYGQDTKPLETPTSEVLGNSYVGGTHQPLQHLQPQYADFLGSRPQSQQQPIGGYSSYDYAQKQHHRQHGHHDPQGIHDEIYRPTQEEAQGHKPHRPSDASKAGRVDKGVNRFLKKLEKNFG